MTDENTELEKTIKMDPPDLSGKTIELPLDDFIPQRKKKKTASVNRTATFFTETLSLFRDHTKDTEETIRAEQGTVRHHNVAQEQDESAFLGKLDDDYERREAFAGGGQGVISVLSNVLPKQTSELCKKFFDGDVAGAAQMQCDMLELINALFCEVNPIPAKAAMAAMGFCENYLRLPLTPMEEATKKVLFERMDALGVMG